jgi:hypothetical protein
MLCFFRLLIDFDWIKGHLISDRIGSGQIRIRSGQFDFLKKLDRVGGFLGSDRVLPTLILNTEPNDSIDRPVILQLLAHIPCFKCQSAFYDNIMNFFVR